MPPNTSVAVTAEAMEVFGGNGYVETGPMGRLFREAPVNSIWEGSGNVMCLDVLRAVARHPDDVHLVLDHLQASAAGERAILAAVQAVRDALLRPGADQEPQARRITQKLALCVQATLMLQHASPTAAAAFVASRFDPDWGTVFGVSAGTRDIAALLRDNWLDMPQPAGAQA